MSNAKTLLLDLLAAIPDGSRANGRANWTTGSSKSFGPLLTTGLLSVLRTSGMTTVASGSVPMVTKTGTSMPLV